MKKFFQNIKFKNISLTTLALALVVSGFLVWGNKIEAAVSVVDITSSTLYVQSGNSIDINFDVTADSTNVGIVKIEIYGGSGTPSYNTIYQDNNAIDFINGTTSISRNVSIDGVLPEGSYDLKISAQQSGNWVTDEELDLVVVDNTAPTAPTILTPTDSGLFVAGNGKTYEITWTASTDTNLGANPITIQYASDGSTFSDVATTEANDGTYTWTVPNADLTTAKIKIIATDLAGNTAESISANAFTIDSTAPAIKANTLLTPSDASIKLKGGDTYEITWTPADITDTNLGTNPITIQYASDGSTFSDVATKEANDRTYTWTIPSDNVATAKIKIIATDLAGNTSEDSSDNAFLVDSTAPTVEAGTFANPIKVATAPTGASASDGGSGIATVLWESVSTPTNGVLLFSNSSSISSTLEGSVADGTYEARVTVTDAVGNVTTDTVSFIWDTTAPTGYSVTFDQDYANSSNETAISFTFAGAEVGATYNYSIDDTNAGTSAVTDTGTISSATDQITDIDVSTLNDETLTITVTLTDPAGNVGAGVTDTIVKDTVAPTVTNTYIATTGNNGTGGGFKNGDIINVSWNNSDAGDNNANIASVTVDFSEFGGEATVVATNTGNIWSATYTLPADVNLTGKKVLVTATDTAGNPTTTADGDTYNVDTEKPTVAINSVTANPTNGDIAVTVEFSESTADFAIEDISVTGGVAEDFAATDGDSYTFNVDPTDGASVAVSISIGAGVATDAAGNTNIASNVLSYTSDTVAPTLPDTGIVGTTIQGASDTITLTFDGLVEPTDGTWSSDEFEEIESPNGTAKTLTGATFSPSSGATTTLTITFAEDSTNLQTYLRNENIITVKPTSSKIKDSAGNFVANSEIVGTTLIEGDSEVPTATSITYSQGGTEVDVINPSTRGQTVLVTVTFSESMHSAPTITIDAQGSDADKTTTMTRTSGTVWYINNWSVPSIDAVQGEATVSFSGTDLAGTAYNSASTSVVIDSMAPKITNLDTVSIATTSATLTATTNEIATCKYSTATRDYTNMTAMTTSNGLTHTVALSSLEAGKTYNYYVKCADNYGNSMQAPEPVSFTTSVDNIAPTAPVITTTAATVNSDYYTISGTVTADATSRQMISIYGESNFLGTSIVPKNGTTWSLVVELPQGISTTFKATSTDDFENTSVDSNTVVITESVSAGSDIVAPTAPVITTSATTINSDYYKIAGTVTADANSKQIVNVLVESEVYGTAIVPKGGTNWSVIVSLPQDTATTFIAKSTDDSGNISNASAGVIITEQQGNGSFGIIERTMTKMTGTADNTYANGWEWIIRVTLPTDQNSFALKFNDWVSGANTMAAGGNMQYYSEQIADGTGSSDSPIAITTANTYPSKVEISTDVDPTLDGIQTDIHVQVKIPTTTPAGSYSTSFQAFYDEPID